MSGGVYARYVKRAVDVVGAAGLLLAGSPVWVSTALGVLLTSRGGVFFRQARVGRNEAPFMLVKLRTMRVDDNPPPVAGVEVAGGDPRVTPFGRFLRRTKLDEWPQLWHVLVGAMSFIGPRPQLPSMIARYEPWERTRAAVRPGLTGLAQVNGNTALDRAGKSYYDVRYARAVGAALDARIALRTVWVVLRGEARYVRPPDAAEIDALRRAVENGECVARDLEW